MHHNGLKISTAWLTHIKIGRLYDYPWRLFKRNKMAPVGTMPPRPPVLMDCDSCNCMVGWNAQIWCFSTDPTPCGFWKHSFSVMLWAIDGVRRLRWMVGSTNLMFFYWFLCPYFYRCISLVSTNDGYKISLEKNLRGQNHSPEDTRTWSSSFCIFHPDRDMNLLRDFCAISPVYLTWRWRWWGKASYAYGHQSGNVQLQKIFPHYFPRFVPPPTIAAGLARATQPRTCSPYQRK
jgi:hypothetical protein